MPITRPRASKRGPPELPWLIGASVWIASTRLYFDVSDSIERWVAETTPTPSEFSFPNGLPIAATGSPTTAVAGLPSGTGAGERFGDGAHRGRRRGRVRQRGRRTEHRRGRAAVRPPGQLADRERGKAAYERAGKRNGSKETTAQSRLTVAAPLRAQAF